MGGFKNVDGFNHQMTSPLPFVSLRAEPVELGRVKIPFPMRTLEQERASAEEIGRGTPPDRMYFLMNTLCNRLGEDIAKTNGRMLNVVSALAMTYNNTYPRDGQTAREDFYCGWVNTLQDSLAEGADITESLNFLYERSERVPDSHIRF